MTRIVADASVVVKWLLPERDHEAGVEPALNILQQVKKGNITLHQPPHWLAEVAAVVTRLSPATARRKIMALYEMECEVIETPEVYLTACELSIEFEHHVFDTLYHAVALHLGRATLVTADERYYQKARSRGGISLLSAFHFPV